MTTPTADDLELAKAAVRVSASVSYQAYTAAKAELARIETALAAAAPARDIAVAGNTYPVRRELAALGLRWNTTARAWVGTVRGAINLPRGCYETTFGAAAVASMDHANSDC